MRRRPLPVLVVLLLAGAGCTDDGDRIRAGSDQADAAHPPRGQKKRIDGIDLSADGRTVTLGFTGAKPYEEDDPCSEEYVGWARVDGDVLEAAVVTKAARFTHGRTSGVTGCDDLGYVREVAVALPEPFEGAVVEDQAGYTRLIAAPDGMAEVTELPAGYELQSEADVPGTAHPRWERVYSPVPDPTYWSDPQLSFLQAFGGPADVGGGERVDVVDVGGLEGLLYSDPGRPGILLVWQLGDDGLALRAHERDFPRAELIRLAETVRSPDGD